MFLDAVYHTSTQRYIALGPSTTGHFGFVVLNVTDGTEVGFLPLQGPFNTSGFNVPENLQIDQSTGDMYAFNAGGPVGPAGVYRIDSHSGETALIGTSPSADQWGVVLATSVYNSVRHEYVLFATDQVR